MSSLLGEIKAQIADPDAVWFAVFYHDLIYDPASQGNEQQSAELAEQRLAEIGFPSDRTKKCAAMILATKAHERTGDNDTDLFTDADLSILGQNPDRYRTYVQQVRQEYALYADEDFRSGRLKMITHFLSMDSIFKTDYFKSRFESAARENLRNERKLWQSSGPAQ